MATLKLDLIGSQTMVEYFKDLDKRLLEMGASRSALARQLNADGAQVQRYFTDTDPNPTAKTLIAIEEAVVTIRRRRAQARRYLPAH
jgi:hypothetical protein